MVSFPSSITQHGGFVNPNSCESTVSFHPNTGCYTSVLPANGTATSPATATIMPSGQTCLFSGNGQSSMKPEQRCPSLSSPPGVSFFGKNSGLVFGQQKNRTAVNSRKVRYSIWSKSSTLEKFLILLVSGLTTVVCGLLLTLYVQTRPLAVEWVRISTVNSSGECPTLFALFAFNVATSNIMHFNFLGAVLWT